ncbi:MAG: hypothetical protein ACYTFA_08535 [Planctomycetota bacterium]
MELRTAQAYMTYDGLRQPVLANVFYRSGQNYACDNRQSVARPAAEAGDGAGDVDRV